ncbi:MAG TPA: hypothetical protein PLV72_01695 [Candidatus Magasanikbacteria bacterium]|nr:hypothetical protein [Candidatus Magasanikbacteria bacterium]
MFDSSVELQLAGCTSSFDGVRNVYLCQKETELHGHCGSVCPINKRGDNKFLLLKNNQPSEVNKVVILSDLECAEASD